MNIKPIRSYIPVNTGLRKVLPAAIAVSAVTAPALTSCNIDNRQNNHKVDWFAVEFNRLSDEDVRKINKTRQAPQNTVFAKINETKTEYYTDREGNRHSREVETGRWHYELVNNRSGMETGTTTLPEGFSVEKDVMGFIHVVETGTKGLFMKGNKKPETQNQSKIGFLEAATGLLSDEQIAQINSTRQVPEGTIIVKTEDGDYDIENDRLNLTTGTRTLPEGYEVRKNILGAAKIVPIDQKSIFLKKKEQTQTQNTTPISVLEAFTGILSDEQIAEINKTKQMPEGTLIAKDELGNYYITNDVLGIDTGTRTLPKGYEVKKDRLGFAIVVPEGTKGIMIK